MQLLGFMLLCSIWLATMGALVTLAPLGENLFLFSVLFFLGHILMALMVWRFSAGLTSKKAFVGVIVLGILARFIFLPYPVGNDVFRYVWE